MHAPMHNSARDMKQRGTGLAPLRLKHMLTNAQVVCICDVLHISVRMQCHALRRVDNSMRNPQCDIACTTTHVYYKVRVNTLRLSVNSDAQIHHTFTHTRMPYSRSTQGQRCIQTALISARKCEYVCRLTTCASV